MATFKAVVREHHQRRDGKFPVSIRVTQNGRSNYISTGLYIGRKQITRSFEIKDQFVLERTNATIRDYEKTLLNVTTDMLVSMSVENVRDLVTANYRKDIDFIAFCQDEIVKDPYKRNTLNSAVSIITKYMGIQTLPVRQFTSEFIRRYRDALDKRKMRNTTKNLYISKLFAIFNEMKSLYNTDYMQVIAHDPTVGYKPYIEEGKVRRSMDVETLRRIFRMDGLTKLERKTIDIMRLEFCLCGINTMDLLTMERSCYDENTKRITYNRHKTKDKRADKALLSVKLEPEAYDVFEKLRARNGEMLFDLGFSGKDVAHDATNRMSSCMRAMRKKYGLDNITPYWFRHTWATIARNKCGVSKDDIDLCLNHVGNNPMADVYIDADWSRVDAANRKVLDYVFHSDKE